MSDPSFEKKRQNLEQKLKSRIKILKSPGPMIVLAQNIHNTLVEKNINLMTIKDYNDEIEMEDKSFKRRKFKVISNSIGIVEVSHSETDSLPKKLEIDLRYGIAYLPEKKGNFTTITASRNENYEIFHAAATAASLAIESDYQRFQTLLNPPEAEEGEKVKYIWKKKIWKKKVWKNYLLLKSRKLKNCSNQLEQSSSRTPKYRDRFQNSITLLQLLKS